MTETQENIEEDTEETFTMICNEYRHEILEIATFVKSLMKHTDFDLVKETYAGQHGEMKANIMLTYRHLEDARMRIGKILQAANDGVSILDKEETRKGANEENN